MGLYKILVGNNPWIIMCHMNVNLDPKEHSSGSSSMTKNMMEFKECVNMIEVEDIKSNGLFYTWTKNLHKTKTGDCTGVLKKLDRVTGSEEFICKYSNAHAIFLPYLISNHYPVILVIPNVVQTRKKAFRFSNFVTDNDEFHEVVKKYWGAYNSGCQMFKAVKNLRLLKPHLKRLAWKMGMFLKM